MTLTEAKNLKDHDAVYGARPEFFNEKYQVVVLRGNGRALFQRGSTKTLLISLEELASNYATTKI
jgi:hypothetical protein